jgi:hypothetical protein
VSAKAKRATGIVMPAPGNRVAGSVVATAAAIGSADIATSSKIAARRIPPAAGMSGAARFAAAAGLASAILLAACTPPEAARIRGGGPGADTGNRDAVVEMHGGSNMYWKTPCKATEAQCPGPLPAAGTPDRDRLLRRWPS